MKYVMYNPLANNKNGKENAMTLPNSGNASEYTFIDFTETADIPGFFASLSPEDSVIVCGGDGTLNRFANALGDLVPQNDIYHYPAGSGNDFMNDVAAGKKNDIIKINEYLKDLPIVTVKGKDYKFLNGIGFGIDGYCCEISDIFQAKSKKKVNYTAIAIKGIAYDYKPTDAKVTVDGVTREYKRVWLAPAMNGRFFGGGMMITPNQDRLNPERTVTSLVMSGYSRLRTLLVFPKIFSGTHVGLPNVDIRTGSEVTVEFSEPRALQIDGETFLDVTSYTVKSAKR